MAFKYVPVAKADTYELIKKAQSGDEEALNLLCEQNTGLVKKLALKFTTSEYEAEDLIQIGYIGLLRAIDKFQPEFDVMFSTYAVPMIMGELKRFFRDNGKIKASRSLKQEIYGLKKAQEALGAKEGETPRLSQIAEFMGISTEHVLEIMEAASALSNVTSLDSQPAAEEYNAYYRQASPENNLDAIMVKKELGSLPKRERQVIVLRYYKDMTQQEIAKRMGISQVQVSRIEKKALTEIRQKIAE